MNKTSSRFRRKSIAQTAAVGIVALSAATAQADFVWSGTVDQVIDLTESTMGDTDFALDIDGDNTNEFVFDGYHKGGRYSLEADPIETGAKYVKDGSVINQFSTGQTINSDEIFNDPGFKIIFSSGGHPGSEWKAPPDAASRGCMGVKFDVDGNTHYGWVEITIDLETQATINSWAWDDTPDTAIVATCNTPLYAEVTKFVATPYDNQVVLEWETASEIDNDGFHIWRATGEGWKTGNYSTVTKLTQQLVPAIGDASSYTYTDSNVTTGLTYYYGLEDVDLFGNSTFHWDLIESATVTKP